MILTGIGSLQFTRGGHTILVTHHALLSFADMHSLWISLTGKPANLLVESDALIFTFPEVLPVGDYVFIWHPGRRTILGHCFVEHSPSALGMRATIKSITSIKDTPITESQDNAAGLGSPE